MNNNDDESDFPHRHNFSALDRIPFRKPTEVEIQVKKKEDEALEKEVAKRAKEPFTVADFEEQLKLILPNGTHKIRQF